MGNIVVSLIIIAIAGLSISKIVSEKRKGSKCMGCPLSGSESKKCNC